MIPANRKSTHPGEILSKEFLEPLNLSRTDLAKHLGVSARQLGLVLNGQRNVTAELAWGLAQAFGTSPEFWTNLQANHDLAINRPKREIRRLRRAG